MRCLVPFWPLLFCAAPPLAAQTPPPRPAEQASAHLHARIRELPAFLSGSGSYETYLTPNFRAQVSKASLDAMIAQLVATYGPAQSIRKVETPSPNSAVVTIAYRHATASAELVVEPAAPYRVSALVIREVVPNERSLADVAASLAQLHGATGFAWARLGTDAPRLLAEREADRAFAIGSAFKLIILAELVRATNAGERAWDDEITLDGAVLPTGGYSLKPKGTRVSLRELATQMISISDNSATDILLKALGRAKVEAMLPVLGVRDAARNRPFLSALELFKLKGIEANDLAGRYLALDEAGRRKMLDGEVADTPALLIRPTLFRDGRPVRIEQLEWFLSPADLVRVMDWLRRNSGGPKGADARAILSKNSGIAAPAAAKWHWVGYKGGSEPGVINMTLLLEAKNGDWYAFAASWNDPAQAVEESRFVMLVSRAAELVAP